MVPYEISAGTVLDDFDDHTTWTLQAGNAKADETAIVRGAGRSMKLTSNTGAWLTAYRSLNRDMSNDFTIGLSVYAADWEKNLDSSFVLRFRQTSTSDYAEKTTEMRLGASSASATRRPGWRKLLLRQSNFTPAGNWTANGGWAQVKSVAVMFKATGFPATYYLDKLVVNEYRRPNVVLSFDDGLPSQYLKAFAIMQTYGLRGSLFVPSTKIGTTNFLTLAQLHEMHDAGWSVGNHTASHLAVWQSNLASLSYATILDEIVRGRDWLAENGFTRDGEHLYFVPPGNQYTTADTNWRLVQDALAAAGCTMLFRSDDNLVQPNELDDVPYVPRVAVPDGSPLSVATNAVDRAINYGAMTAINLHGIADVPGTNEWNTADFTKLCQYLYCLSPQVDELTLPEWRRGLDGARRLRRVWA